MSTVNVVTRFAPSPTGYLHVGGARTALFNWLLARHFGGRFLLRIEDTDTRRSTEAATSGLIDDLTWLGLHWDNSQLVFQSKRVDVYNRIFDDLLSRGLAYKAFETPDELDGLRRQAEMEKRSYIYRRPRLTNEDVARLEAEGRSFVIRFATPVKEYRFDDVVLGKPVVLPPTQVQDFVIRKTDGMPTYHFAVVVDDAEMGVTHILRGQEHLLNTHNHIALQEALGYPRPIYGHLPIIMNVDGSKMSKRDRDKRIRHEVNLWIKKGKSSLADLAKLSLLSDERLSTWLADAQQQLDLDEQAALMRATGLSNGSLPEILVHEFRENGYLPEVLLNFLALLGWSPGGDRERMSMDEMTQLFSIEGIGKSNAKFSREKLLAFNTEACAAASEQRLVAGFRDYLSVNPDSPLSSADDATLAKLLRMKKGFRVLREVDELTRFFFIADEQLQYDPDAVEKVLKKNDGQGLNVLREIERILSVAADWSAESLERSLQQYCEEKKLGLGKVAQPVRVAISGTTVSPPIFQSLEFLGKDRSLARIRRCAATIPVVANAAALLVSKDGMPSLNPQAARERFAKD